MHSLKKFYAITPAAYLLSKGWRQTEVTAQSSHRITWWENPVTGSEIPQHLAVWFELMADGRPDLAAKMHREVFAKPSH